MKRHAWMMWSVVAVVGSALIAPGAFAKEKDDNEGVYVTPPSMFFGSVPSLAQQQTQQQTQQHPQQQTPEQAQQQAQEGQQQAEQRPLVNFFAPWENPDSDK
ncbi:hypothetical protein O3V59_08360 [Brevibacillus thermoruber]|uniref:Uncharacterized protein n=1 Tax=Brevibacillus thermoruber TaxID=33942 RepID=A0A9X3TPG4_9BACL|nr:hypothetical protein [Brevibacillus thermoruber]MDA5108371.1 hypothetical protein [Brevibacillus thermoruber]